MVEYRGPTASERDELLRMILDQLGSRSANALTLLGLTPDESARIYRTTGEGRVVLDGERDVGYLWIEERDCTVHIHAIILQPGARGKGIGSRVIPGLATEFAPRVAEIELVVQNENHMALRFYERLGFRKTAVTATPDFSILRLPLNPPVPAIPQMKAWTKPEDHHVKITAQGNVVIPADRSRAVRNQIGIRGEIPRTLATPTTASHSCSTTDRSSPATSQPNAMPRGTSSPWRCGASSAHGAPVGSTPPTARRGS